MKGVLGESPKVIIMYYLTKEPKLEVRTPEWFLNKISNYDISSKLKTNLKFGEFRFAKNRTDFGFISEYNIFCHVKSNTELQNQTEDGLAIVEVEESPKGLVGKNLHFLTVKEYEALKAKVAEKLSTEFNERERNFKAKDFEKWEKQEEINQEMGFAPISVEKENHNNYGSWTRYEFVFSRNISEEEFKTWLTRQGFDMEAPTVDAPVCQGSVDFYGYGKEWIYKWTDVYYD